MVVASGSRLVWRQNICIIYGWVGLDFIVFAFFNKGELYISLCLEKEEIWSSISPQVQTKYPSFCRRHFLNNSHVISIHVPASIITEGRISNLDNFFALNRRDVIIWNKDDLVYCRIYASLDLGVLGVDKNNKDILNIGNIFISFSGSFIQLLIIQDSIIYIYIHLNAFVFMIHMIKH